MSEPADQLEVAQEVVDNVPTDVEVEDPEAGVGHDPWDPEQIRIHTKAYSLRHLMDMIDDGDVDLAPDFQRQYVWKDAQRWGLIESLLLGIPLPSFYFNENREGLMQVVDGVQRLTTIHRFYKGEFSLGRLAYLKDLEGKQFKDLDGSYRRRLQNTQFVAHVIDPETPFRVKFDVFKRINTGGSPLSAQEIRHCMSKAQSRDFLRALVDLTAFEDVMGKTVLNHPRMADREIALRLVAFHIIPVEDYRQYESLDSFLGVVTERIDALSAGELKKLEAVAERGLVNSRAVFGEFAFRKWPLTSARRNPINRTLVETWGTLLAEHPTTAVKARAVELRRRAREMMTSNVAFIDSISGGTGDVNKVTSRMTLVGDAIREYLG